MDFCTFVKLSQPLQSAHPAVLHNAHQHLVIVRDNDLQASAVLSDMDTMATDGQGLKIGVKGGVEDESLWRSPGLSENSDLQQPPPQSEPRSALDLTEEAILPDQDPSRTTRTPYPQQCIHQSLRRLCCRPPQCPWRSDRTTERQPIITRLLTTSKR